MSTSQSVCVVHLITSDMPAHRWMALCAQLNAGDPRSAAVVWLGTGAAVKGQLANGTAVHRIPHSIGSTWGRSQRLDRALQKTARSNDLVLHAWSAEALEWCWRLRTPCRIFVEVDLSDPYSDIARRMPAPNTSSLAFVCPTDATERSLARTNVGPWRRVRVPYAFDRSPLDRAAARRRLGLADDDRVILALPPISHDSGALYAVWGFMIFEKTQRNARIIVPEYGPEVSRIRRLAQACGHLDLFRFSGATPLPELLPATDAAVFTPIRPVATWAVAVSHDFGLPMVCADLQWLRESSGEDVVHFCRLRDPRDTTRALRRAFDDVAAPVRRSTRVSISAAEAVQLREQAYARGSIGRIIPRAANDTFEIAAARAPTNL